MKIRTKLSITFILLLIFGVTAISSYSILFIRGYLLNQAIDNLKQDALWMSLTLEGIDETFANRLRLARISNITGYHISVFDSSGVLITEYPEIGAGIESGGRPGEEAGDDTATSAVAKDIAVNGAEFRHRITSGASTGEGSDTRTGGQPAGRLSDSLLTALYQAPGRLLVVNRRDEDFVHVYTTIDEAAGTAPTGGSAARLSGDYTRLVLRISTHRETIFEPVRTIRWIIYTGMFISIGLILIVSFTFSRYMSKPIMQLTDASKRIASGDVDHKITLNRTDEFGVLADSINQMASTLRADNEQLKKIYERQQQFIADIAHEIRNPLHTILGSIEMLELKDLPEEKKQHYLRNTKNQAERISSLFKDLILLQRSVSDDHFLTPRVFDLSSVTTRVENIYKERLAGRNINFRVDKHFCKVYGDPERIEQVLDNLVSNSEKYTSEGFIRLRYFEHDGKIRIQVEDSGIGISSDHLPFLFNRFYRTDKARSRDSGGAGLGLAVVKSIIDTHETSIHVESIPGEGTRVFFDLVKKPSDRPGKAKSGEF